jgi:Flp pilus assembly protein TadG
MTIFRSDSGAAAVEFALIVPIIALLCCAVVDYGQAVNLSTELRSAARTGAQYALAHPNDTNGITWAAQHATKVPSTDMTVTAVTAVPGGGSKPFYCTCADSDPVLTNQIDCNTESCVSPAVKKFFIAVTTTQTYTPILPYPGLPSSIAMTGSAAIQLQ